MSTKPKHSSHFTRSEEQLFGCIKNNLKQKKTKQFEKNKKLFVSTKVFVVKFCGKKIFKYSKKKKGEILLRKSVFLKRIFGKKYFFQKSFFFEKLLEKSFFVKFVIKILQGVELHIRFF